MRKGYTVNGCAQYSLNMDTTMSMVMPSLVRSVPVISMKTLRVFSVSLLWSPLMMGGSDSTVLFAS